MFHNYTKDGRLSSQMDARGTDTTLSYLSPLTA